MSAERYLVELSRDQWETLKNVLTAHQVDRKRQLQGSRAAAAYLRAKDLPEEAAKHERLSTDLEAEIAAAESVVMPLYGARQRAPRRRSR